MGLFRQQTQVSSVQLEAPLLVEREWGMGHKESALVQHCFKIKKLLDGSSELWIMASCFNQQVLEESFGGGLAQR